MEAKRIRAVITILRDLGGWRITIKLDSERVTRLENTETYDEACEYVRRTLLGAGPVK